MPTREPITNTIIPQKVEPEIPVRIVQTKSSPIVKSEPKIDQPNTGIGISKAADSAPPAESVKLSPQLSALARKEQAIRQRENALKARESEHAQKLADAEKFGQLKAKLSAKDYSEIESLGLNYEGYTEYLLNKQQGSNPQQEALKKLQEEIQNLKKNTEESTTREYEETVSEYRKEVNKLASSDPRFSSVKELKREEAALQFILDSWEQDGQEVTIEQALQAVEDYSLEEANQFKALSKLKPAEKVEEKPPPKPGLKTLTNQVTVGSTEKEGPKKSLQFLSESERYAEARRRVMARKQSQ
jgi:hypothetical protein